MTTSELIEKAKSFFEAREFDEAVEAANAVIKAAPDNRDALELKGAALATKGDFINAIPVMQKILHLDPTSAGNAGMIALLAKALGQIGNYDEALRIIGASSATYPQILEDASLRLQQGAVLAGKGDFISAIPALQKAIELDPSLAGNVGIVILLARAFIETGKPADVLETINVASRLHPHILEDASIRLQQGIAFNAQGRGDRALEILLKIDESALAQSELAMLRLQEGLAHQALQAHEKALPVFQKAIELIPPGIVRAFAWIHQARSHVALNDLETAKQSLDNSRQEPGPWPTEFFVQRATLLNATGRSDDALADLDAAAKFDPTAEKTLKFLDAKTRTLVLLQRYDEVAKLFQNAAQDQALAADPTFQLLSLDALVYTGNTEAAIEKIQGIAAQQPEKENAAAWFLRSVAFGALGRFKESLEDLEQAKRLDPSLQNSSVPLITETSALTNLGRHQEALEVANKLVSLYPAMALAHSFRGVALVNLEQNEEALTEFDKTVELAGTDVGATLAQSFALIQKGGALTAMKRPEDAIESFRKGQTLAAEAGNFPYQISARIGQSLALYGRSTTEPEKQAQESKLEALKLATDAVELSERTALAPARALALSARGNILAWLERDEEALFCYRQATETQPTDAAIRLWLGETYDRLQDYERAAEAFAGATQYAVRPDESAEAWLGRGRALHYLQRHEEAIEACRQAIGANGESQNILELLGAAYSAMGRHTAALQTFQRGWALGKPNHRSAALALGVSAELLTLDRNAEARSFLEKAEKDTKFSGPMYFNYGVALYRLKNHGPAASALRKASKAGVAGADEYADKLQGGGGANNSWLDFWFGPARWMRKPLGSLLLLLLVFAVLPALLKPSALSFLPWLDLSKDWKVMLIPIVLITALLALPSLKRIAVGKIEVDVSQPEPQAGRPDLDTALKALQATPPTGIQG
jgi:tetratricopeptide (TPR) repeat protein